MSIRDVDLTPFADMAYWSHGSEVRADMFRQLRDEAPVLFMEEPEIEGLPKGPGFWSVTRHADVVHVSRHADVFSSAQGTTIVDLPQELNEFMGSMINMDAPRHTRLRQIVNKSFTPRMVNRIDEDVRVKARNILADVADTGGCDLVSRISAPLPLQIICEMMGIPATSGDGSWSSPTSCSATRSRSRTFRPSWRRSWRWPRSPGRSVRTVWRNPATTWCRR